MSDQFNDFEKVDPETYQDENVTSTSMTGDMAEEDRYPDGSSAQNDIDMFSSGGGTNTDFTEPKPLISFEPSVEPTAPPMEAENSVSGAKPVDGNWMKNVDPRDKRGDMADDSEVIPAEPQAQSDHGVIKLTGDKQQAVYKEEEETSEKELDSDLSEYSSSGDESDSEPSDTETSDDDLDKHDKNPEHQGHTQENDNLCQNLDKSCTSEDNSEVVKKDLNVANMETNIDTLSDGAYSEVVRDENKGLEDQNISDIGTEEPLKHEYSDKETSERNTAGIECDISEKSHDLGETESKVLDFDKQDSLLTVKGTNISEENNISKTAQNKDEPNTVELEQERICETEEMISDNTKAAPSFGISETELSDVLDKLTNDDDIIDSISPVVSDYEKEIDTRESEMFRESSGSPEMMSEDSGSCSDNDSVDSDISGDEEVCGTWNPSPLYEFTREEGEEEEDMSDENEETAVNNNYNLSGNSDSSALPQRSIESDNKLNELREDVKGLMEEMESLVKQGHEDVHYFDDSDPDLESSNIEVVGASATTQSSFKHSDRNKHNLGSDTNEPDMLHVRFHSPTNTLFYDPESPIVERVSEEVQHELIDYDDEAKDLENEKETCNVIVQAQLQAEVVKDLKDVYEKLEAYKEAGKESTDNTIEYNEMELESETKEPPDPSVFNLYNRKEVKESDPEEEEVVLRQKNNLNTDAALHRSQRISEAECNSMIIHDLEPTMVASISEPVEEVIEMGDSSNNELEILPDNSYETSGADNDDPTEMKSSTESMIIHDEDTLKSIDDVLESPVSMDNEKESVKKESDSVPVDPIVNKLANELVEQIFKEADKVVEKMKNNVSDRDNVTSDMTAELDLDENVCHSDEEVIDESVPFNDSLNNTVIETDVIESENMSEIAESSTVQKLENIENSNRTNTNEQPKVMTINNTENENESVSKKENPTGQQRTMEIILLILEQVLELIYWRDVKKTGVVFGSMMFILLSLSICSIMSVLAYLSLAVLTVTLSFRVYKNVMQAVQKTNEGHPFKNLLDMDIALQEDVVKNAADKIAQNINNCAKELRRLYLVEDYVDTLKFGLMLWLMTYIGAWFDGMTLVILVVISIFTLPKVYETYKVPIDQNVNLVRAQLNNIMAQVSAKLPFPKKKPKTQ